MLLASLRLLLGFGDFVVFGLGPAAGPFWAVLVGVFGWTGKGPLGENNSSIGGPSSIGLFQLFQE